MYFPYLRGRQFELIALRELLESERIGQEIMQEWDICIHFWLVGKYLK